MRFQARAGARCQVEKFSPGTGWVVLPTGPAIDVIRVHPGGIVECIWRETEDCKIGRWMGKRKWLRVFYYLTDGELVHEKLSDEDTSEIDRVE